MVMPVDDAALAGARQSWRAAEARLYPLAMTNVDGYQRALVLVAAIVVRLREVARTPAQIVACTGDAAEFVASACDASGASAHGLEIDDLFGSAAASRDRELAGEERRVARLAAIERARARGSEWADVHSDPLGPRVPELRLHVASGWAILTTMGADETTSAPVLLVATVQVDLTTGELRDRPESEVRSVTSAEQWEAVAAVLQADAP